MDSLQTLREKVNRSAKRMNALVKFDADGNAVTPWNDDVSRQFAEAKTEWEGAMNDLKSYEDAIKASRMAERGMDATALVADRHNLSFDETAGRINLYQSTRRANMVQRLGALANHLGDGVIERINTQNEDDRAFEAWLRGAPMNGARPGHISGIEDGYRKAAASSGLRNAWTRGTAATGGELASERFSAEVVISLISTSSMLRVADVQVTDFLGQVNFPNVTATKGSINGEGGAAAKVDPATGNRPINFDKFDSGFVEISDVLVGSTTYDIEAVLAEYFGMRIGAIEEEVYTSGSTVQGTHSRGFTEDVPAGMVETASAGEETAIKYATLVSGLHKVPQAYRLRGAAWMMNDTTMGQIRQMVDTQGRPLWLPMQANAEGSSILGYPVEVNAEMPDQAADAYPIAFGYWRAYKVLKFGGLPLVEVFLNDKTDRTKGQISFLAQEWAGGRLVDTKAISRIRNA